MALSVSPATARLLPYLFPVGCLVTTPGSVSVTVCESAIDPGLELHTEVLSPAQGGGGGACPVCPQGRLRRASSLGLV